MLHGEIPLVQSGIFHIWRDDNIIRTYIVVQVSTTTTHYVRTRTLAREYSKAKEKNIRTNA